MARKKHKWKSSYLALAIVIGLAGAYFFLTRMQPQKTAPLRSTQTGYKIEDRLELEKLIHKGTKSD